VVSLTVSTLVLVGWSRLVEVMRMELFSVMVVKPLVDGPILLLQVNVFGVTTP